VPALVPPRFTGPQLEDALARLYVAQRVLTPNDDYLTDHARPRVTAGQVAAFRWYLPLLPPSGAVLDWGCNHAPDSCLLRAAAGDRYDLHACDFRPPDDFAAFHRFARLTYGRLAHLYQLPYGDARFDAVIASGVLEHVAWEYESLKELHRVLRPGGVLIVTYLPNRWSVGEWARRNIVGRNFHHRLYVRTEFRRVLLRTGFEVTEALHQSTLRADWRGVVARVLPPVAALGSVLCFAARKVHSL
jgi:SAM-dependent methyltransferase